MSHEIRTPMNGVLGMVDVLERQGLNEAQRRSVSTIRDSAQALLHIIDAVLDFSKIEAGRLELEATAFSLSGLMEGALDTFRPQAVAKALVLDAEIEAGSDDALLGDPTRVRQILLNLLSNALKFTERGDVRVCVGTAPLGDGSTRVTFAVCDTGIGLDAEQSPGFPALRASRHLDDPPIRGNRAWSFDRPPAGARWMAMSPSRARQVSVPRSP